MIEAHGHISKALDELDSRLRRAKSGPVGSQSYRDTVKAFVRSFFNEARPSILAGGISEDRLAALDAEMQELLIHAQKRTLKKKYAATLKTIRKTLDDLELDITCKAVVKTEADHTIEKRDQAILDTLAKICLSARTSYCQGILDLADGERLSWRGTATEFREALRETLDVMAPDDAVKGQAGFKQEANTTGPTMKQKVAFILKSRRESSAALETAKSGIEVIEEKTGAFVRSVYTRSSASTHGTASRNEAASIKDHVALVLTELLQLQR